MWETPGTHSLLWKRLITPHPKEQVPGTVGGAHQAAASTQAGPASPWGWAHRASSPPPLGHRGASHQPCALLSGLQHPQAVREGFLSGSPNPSDEAVHGAPDCSLPVGRERGRTQTVSLQPPHQPLRDENPAICQRKAPLRFPLGLHLRWGLTSG